MRHPEDARTIAFGLLFALSLLLQWVVLFPRLSLLGFLLTTFQSLQGGVAVHNACHSPPMRTARGNRLLFLALTLWQGAPVASYVPGHNESHHRHLQTDKDVMRTTQMTWSCHALNLLLFFPTVLPAILRNDHAYMRARRGTPLHAQFLAQSAVLYAFLLALLALDARKALLLYVAPTVCGKALLVTLNLLQHDGCDERSEHNHSRNFTSPLLNYLLFHNGYHTAHHEAPGLHWSKLPEAHAHLAPHIHPSLLQPSLLGYVVRTFFLGRPREATGLHASFSSYKSSNRDSISTLASSRRPSRPLLSRERT